jgi:hypothetical protein
MRSWDQIRRERQERKHIKKALSEENHEFY